MLGLYLGDGCLSLHRRSVYKLRLTLDAAYPSIVSEAAGAMRAVMPVSSVGRYARPYGDIEVYAYSKGWPCLFPQHGPGPKHGRPIALGSWQEEIVRRAPHLLLRGLIHSDGCRFFNTGRGGWRHPRYAFRNRSEGVRRIFCDACDLLGLRWTLSGEVVYVSRRDDVARLDEFIGPKR